MKDNLKQMVVLTTSRRLMDDMVSSAHVPVASSIRVLAPLPGCDGSPIRVPVVSLVPRSTTGYTLKSLRDDGHILLSHAYRFT